jgi:uncharacterized protein YndB with AHSA1/START domain
MNPTPTGRLVATALGRDLVLTRTFRAPIGDVWASLTEPERTARWIGPWTGESGVGRTVTLTLIAEEGAPESAVTIDVCDPPNHLAVTTVDEHASWRLEARLSHAGGVTTLEFVHHLDDDVPAGEVGAGWEYYLDRLVAARDDAPMPDFDEYYPAMKPYFEDQQT